MVAQNYFLLRQYDAQLIYSKETVAADNDILRLNTIKYKGGDAAITDVYQAQVLVQQAEAEVISLNQAIEQTENNISILLGKNPRAIPRGLTSDRSAAHARACRQDCHRRCWSGVLTFAAMKRTLVAANANVGVAKAAFFPQISLTGEFGASQYRHLQLPRRAGDLLGAWVARSRSRSSRAAGSAAIIDWPGRSAMKRN